MNTTQQTLDLISRPKLRISEVERLIRIKRIIVPPLSRRKLIALCEDGTLETAPRPPQAKRPPYLIYEDSFIKWVRELDSR